MVQQMVQKLSGAAIYPDAGNVQTNEKLWDVYASEWGAEAGWVAGMAASNRDEAERLENVGRRGAGRAHEARRRRVDFERSFSEDAVLRDRERRRPYW